MPYSLAWQFARAYVVQMSLLVYICVPRKLPICAILRLRCAFLGRIIARQSRDEQLPIPYKRCYIIMDFYTLLRFQSEKSSQEQVNSPSPCFKSYFVIDGQQVAAVGTYRPNLPPITRIELKQRERRLQVAKVTHHRSCTRWLGWWLAKKMVGKRASQSDSAYQQIAQDLSCAISR